MENDSGVSIAARFVARTLRSNTDIVKTVLLVDDNLGFAFWLGQALDRAGYETWPARSVPAAESLLEEVPLAVDLLVINASLPRAPAFATRFGPQQDGFQGDRGIRRGD